ncbi:hypothetical protein [Nonomuraea rhizosphaerae]|uniref:hypothetical protein n=1 Tax=Nonomuraea rhizosphaerae TaxID=2665663 RepID=UPI001C5DC93C|nr:hypothetical protein [Nonomuraea rhizosphaerae]
MAKAKPDEWYLVVPTDLTPSEIKWFDGLQEKFPFVKRWYGKGWLNTQIANHPDLQRYFLKDQNAEVLDILREMNAERGVLEEGIPDLVKRVGILASRAYDSSASHYLGFSSGQDGISITVSPKAGGANNIEFIPRFNIKGDPERVTSAMQEFQQVIDYGGEVTLAAPQLADITITAPQELGISGTFQVDSISFKSLEDTTGLPLRGTLAVIDASGNTRRIVHVNFDRRQAGQRGLTLHGQITGNLLRVQTRLDIHERKGKLDIEISQEAFQAAPAVLLPVLQFIGELLEGRVLRMKIAGMVSETVIRSPMFQALRPRVAVVEDLAYIQNKLGLYFPMPEPLESGDFHAIRNTRKLLSGEGVSMGRGPIRAHIHRHRLQNFLSMINKGGMLYVESENIRFLLADQEFNLGPGYYVCPHVELGNRRQLLAIARLGGNGENPEAVFELADDHVIKLKLGTRQDLAPE